MLPDAFLAHPQLAGVACRDRLEAPAAEHPITGVAHRFAQPLTFTPFASARPCSARCVFCSETLQHREATVLSASLRPRPDYATGLRRALGELRGLPIGLSLSGLESTDDADWLLAVLAALAEHAAVSPVEERVLYTNAAGLARAEGRARLLPALAALPLTRAEVSRHHFDAARNDAIMRFRPGEAVREDGAFTAAVRATLAAVPVRLVCIIQAGGIADLAGMLVYLQWARELGVRDVVLREFSRLHDLYRDNATARAIHGGRVAIEPLVLAALADPAFTPIELTRGYYFWNLRLRWRDVDVTLETSDYELMKSHHRSDTIYKLVYHANGHLCGDWDPGTRVLLRTHEGPRAA